MRADSQPRHPFFSEAVEAELAPADQSQLWVCPTADGKIASVHIVKDGAEIYRSEITRDETSIQQIVIRNATNRVLEDHQWSKLPNGMTPYALTFAAGEGNEDQVSIFADFP